MTHTTAATMMMMVLGILLDGATPPVARLTPVDIGSVFGNRMMPLTFTYALQGLTINSGGLLFV